MNKGGGLTDMFIFLVLAFAIVVIFGIFIYMGNVVSIKLHQNMDNMTTSPSVNNTEILNNTMDKVAGSYNVLKWGSGVLIFAMIISIFVGSYLVQTKPIYFVPYIFVVLIALFFAVVIANAYNTMSQDPIIGSSFSSQTIAHYFLLYLPFAIVAIGFIGGIIMYASYKFGYDGGYVAG